MNPANKPKRPPPLPSFGSSKFEQQKKGDELQKKLDSFFDQISKSTEARKQQQKKEPQKQQATAISGQVQPPVTDKKKFNLASINSKLNTMLSSKKINLNTAVVKAPQNQKPSTTLNPEKVQKKRSEIPTQYDPNTPNNYDFSKHFYSQKLSELDCQSSGEQEPQKNKMVNKTGLNLQKISQEMKSEEQIPEAQMQEEEALQEKEQVALRMMQKFGYKVGTGLGKQSQGITTPLTIKKTTDTSCIIQQSSINLNQLIKPQISAKNALLAHGVQQTQVIVFVNLVRMQQLTEQVEKQLKQQCSTFGQIKNWMVLLLKVSENNQELRIFVQYERKQQAFSAFCRLNNRYYGQNLTSIRFYPREQFSAYKLSLPVHGHIET